MVCQIEIVTKKSINLSLLENKPPSSAPLTPLVSNYQKYSFRQQSNNKPKPKSKSRGRNNTPTLKIDLFGESNTKIDSKLKSVVANSILPSDTYTPKPTNLRSFLHNLESKRSFKNNYYVKRNKNTCDVSVSGLSEQSEKIQENLKNIEQEFKRLM